MNTKARLKFDKIHYWSEIKLDIIKDYAAAYSQIMSAQKDPKLHHVYIDAFAGAIPLESLPRISGEWMPFGAIGLGAKLRTNPDAICSASSLRKRTTKPW